MYLAQLKNAPAQQFSNPYDAMSALLGTEGEAAVYVIAGGRREDLMRRSADGVWST